MSESDPDRINSADELAPEDHDADEGSDHCHRVRGHYSGTENKTTWMASLAEAEQTFREIKRGNWTQLCIERSDGSRKPAPGEPWSLRPEGEQLEGDSS